MIVDVISIASGLISIGLAIYAICFAKKESTQSTENYRRSKELLEEIKKVVYSRPSQNLCKPPMWCRIEAPHWRFL